MRIYCVARVNAATVIPGVGGWATFYFTNLRTDSAFPRLGSSDETILLVMFFFLQGTALGTRGRSEIDLSVCGRPPGLGGCPPLKIKQEQCTTCGRRRRSQRGMEPAAGAIFDRSLYRYL